jgi:hypothetical protein
MSRDRQGAAYLTWGHQSETSFGTAKKHWNRFLTAVPDSDLVKLCAPPIGGKTYDTMMKENVSYQLFDRYGGYLLHAKWMYNPENPLSFLSADRYLSAIKNGILRDIVVIHKENRDLSNVVGMKKIRDGMKKGFEERAIDANKHLVNSHETTTSEDSLTVATVCVWSDDVETACMFAYFIALIQLAGRGVECSLVPFVAVSLSHPPEFPNKNEKIPLVELWRSKTLLQQKLSIFPHRDNFLQDWCFALAYSMVANTSPNGFLFPSFAAKADIAFRDVAGGAAEVLAGPEAEVDLAGLDADVELAEAAAEEGDDPQHGDAATEAVAGAEVQIEDVDENGETMAEIRKKAKSKQDKAKSQGVSKYYKHVVDTLIKHLRKLNEAIADALVEAEAAGEFPNPFASQKSINPSISSHSNKRYAINLAEDHPMIKTQDTARRAGYDLRSVATIFENLLRENPFRDRQVGLVFNDWSAVTPLGLIGGGRPPRLEAVQAHALGAKAADFAAVLFCHYDNIEVANDPEMRHLLLATVVRFLPQFLDLLVEHPTHRFGKSRAEAWDLHSFTKALKHAGSVVGGITTDTLMEWSDLIVRDFVSRNSAYVPMQAIQQAYPNAETFVTDHRTLAGYLQAIAIAGQATQVEQSEIRAQGNTMMAALTAMQAQNSHMQAQNSHLLAQLHQKDDQILALLQSIVNAPAVAADSNIDGGGMDEANSINNGDGGGDGHATTNAMDDAANNFPKSIASMTVKNLFIDWHTQEHYKYIADPSITVHTRSAVKFTIEYFTFFLKKHIPPLPPLVLSPLHPGATAWRRELLELTNAAWEEAEKLYELKTHGAKLSEKVSVFKKWMTELSATDDWPAGPPGESCFKPPEKYKMRTYDELSEHQVKSRKKARVAAATAQANTAAATAATNTRATAGATTAAVAAAATAGATAQAQANTAAATAATNIGATAGAAAAGEQMLGTASGEQGELGTSRRHF